MTHTPPPPAGDLFEAILKAVDRQDWTLAEGLAAGNRQFETFVTARRAVAEGRSPLDATGSTLTEATAAADPDVREDAGPPFGGFGGAAQFGGVATASLTPPSLASPTAFATAFGFPLFSSMLDFVLRSNEQQLEIQRQQVSTAQLIADLERVSPTRAASVATQLGLPSGVDFDFLKPLGQGLQLAPASGERVSRTLAGQELSVPGVLSGSELAFAGANPNFARQLADVADFVGLPDLFPRSAAALVPTSAQLIGMAG